MQQQQPFILIVGGADTGRAPMTVALLRRLVAQSHLGWEVESAGVTGHDDDRAESEARAAMTILGLDIQEHRARSVSDELVAAARVVLAVDSGTARVVKLWYPATALCVITLGELAGRQRDIPDPFRMQVGAWVSYAREIEALLQAGLERLRALLEGAPLPALPAPSEHTMQPAPAPAGAPPGAVGAVKAELADEVASGQGQSDNGPRRAAVERCLRLVRVISEMPEVVAWEQARRQLKMS